jgi:hypothetical protein
MSYTEQNDDEGLDDSEMPDDSDVPNDDDSVDTVPCPYCRKPIFEQAEVCPHCGSYISMEDAPSRKPLWIVISTVVILAAIGLFWIWRRIY